MLLSRLKERLCDEDLCQCEVRPMGGKLVLLSDRVDSKVKDLVANEDERLLKWFSSIRPWSKIEVVEEEPSYAFEKGINRFVNYTMSTEPPHQAQSPSFVEDSLNGPANTQLELWLMATSCMEDETLVKKTGVANMAVAKSVSAKKRNLDMLDIVYYQTPREMANKSGGCCSNYNNSLER
ncbi:hypothetical protein Ancab_015012 [Ancistrocladus abbreviatus]